MTIVDRKLTKSLSNFEINNLLLIFIFELSFIDCILSKIVGFDQLWTAVQQKLATANRKLVFFKMPNTFCQVTVQNCQYFLPCLCNYRPYVTQQLLCLLRSLFEHAQLRARLSCVYVNVIFYGMSIVKTTSKEDISLG